MEEDHAHDQSNMQMGALAAVPTRARANGKKVRIRGGGSTDKNERTTRLGGEFWRSFTTQRTLNIKIRAPHTPTRF